MENKKEKNKIPNDVNKKIIKNIFINLIIAIIVMLYLMGINEVSLNVEQETLENIMKVSTLTLLGMGLILIEIAYKKESRKYFIHSVEALVIAAHSLSIMHVIKVFDFNFEVYILTSSYIFSIYYVLKTILIYTKGQRDYFNSLSDISEIVKKDKPLKKEATKKEVKVND